jgi:hypothetical protein
MKPNNRATAAARAAMMMMPTISWPMTLMISPSQPCGRGWAVARSQPPPGFDLGQRGGSLGEQPCEHGRDLGEYLGLTIVDCSGYAMRTTAGISVDRISCTESSSAPLIVPSASVVVG